MSPCSLCPLAALITADILHPSQVDSTNAPAVKKQIDVASLFSACGCVYLAEIKVDGCKVSPPVRHYVHISRQCRISLLDSLRPAVSGTRPLRENKTRENSSTAQKAVMIEQKHEAPGISDSLINLCVRWT